MRKLLLLASLLFIFTTTWIQAQVTSSVEQVSATYLLPSSLNNPIIRIKIDNMGIPLDLFALFLNTGSSNNPLNDIDFAKIFYTGSSTVFDTTVQYGVSVATPSNSFMVNSTFLLSTGVNYFWLAYDTKSTATTCDTLDAICTTVYVATGTQTPAVTDPPGSAIVGLCPTNTENITADNTFSLYPNPYLNELTIERNSTHPLQFTLYNSLGEKIIEKTLLSTSSTINLSAYSSDIYFYQLHDDMQVIKSGRIIRQ